MLIYVGCGTAFSTHSHQTSTTRCNGPPSHHAHTTILVLFTRVLLSSGITCITAHKNERKNKLVSTYSHLPSTTSSEGLFPNFLFPTLHTSFHTEMSIGTNTSSEWPFRDRASDLPYSTLYRNKHKNKLVSNYSHVPSTASYVGMFLNVHLPQ